MRARARAIGFGLGPACRDEGHAEHDDAHTAVAVGQRAEERRARHVHQHAQARAPAVRSLRGREHGVLVVAHRRARPVRPAPRARVEGPAGLLALGPLLGYLRRRPRAARRQRADLAAQVRPVDSALDSAAQEGQQHGVERAERRLEEHDEAEDGQPVSHREQRRASAAAEDTARAEVSALGSSWAFCFVGRQRGVDSVQLPLTLVKRCRSHTTRLST